MPIHKFLRKLFKERAMINFYKKFIGKGDLCFDIGANIGQRTNIFIKLGARVISVEPQNSCLKILQEKFIAKEPVTILNCALGSTEREGDLMLCAETDACSTLSQTFVSAYAKASGFHWQGVEKVQVTTLDNLCQQYGVPQLCKIDVEGYESEVLRGLTSPIPYICFEFNALLAHDTIKSLERLSELGPYQCNFIQYEHMDLVLPEWIPIDEFRSNFSEFVSADILTGEVVVRLEEK
ncbi:MAG: FkbM family methyltransferase [Bacteroidetes bacterium]|nr:MAG: FkbM family methyltransferase [Bacteroidota bacterium]